MTKPHDAAELALTFAQKTVAIKDHIFRKCHDTGDIQWPRHSFLKAITPNIGIKRHGIGVFVLLRGPVRAWFGADYTNFDFGDNLSTVLLSMDCRSFVQEHGIALARDDVSGLLTQIKGLEAVGRDHFLVVDDFVRQSEIDETW